MEIVAMDYTDSNINDCQVVKNMCGSLSGKVRNVRADGAYDTEEFYKIIEEWRAEALIPPARTSKSQAELSKQIKKKEHLKQRDKTIKRIREYNNFDEGLKQWKVESGYHRRSLVEACMFRMKRTFGFHLQQKTERGRRNEIITKINLLNLMVSFGRAQYSN